MAPLKELSTIMTADVPPFHPEIVPSRVQNRKFALVPLGKRNAVVPLETCPVGEPTVRVLDLPAGMLGFVEVMEMVGDAPAVLYTVAMPVPVSLIHKGLVALVAMPKGLIRLGSVRSATPG